MEKYEVHMEFYPANNPQSSDELAEKKERERGRDVLSQFLLSMWPIAR